MVLLQYLKCTHVRLIYHLNFPPLPYETRIKACIQLELSSTFNPVLQKRIHVTNDTVSPAIRPELMFLQSPGCTSLANFFSSDRRPIRERY